MLRKPLPPGPPREPGLTGSGEGSANSPGDSTGQEGLRTTPLETEDEEAARGPPRGLEMKSRRVVATTGMGSARGPRGEGLG